MNIFHVLELLIGLLIGLPMIISEASAQTYSSSLSSLQVTAIAQDSDGYIWLGTSHGLNRYNGTNYAVFYSSSEPDGLNNDNITCLCEDSEGTLWIGTEYGIGWYRNKKFHHLNQTVFDPVTAIAELDSKNIVTAGRSGLFKFSKDSLAMAGYYYEKGASMAKNLLVTKTGDIWMPLHREDSTFLVILNGELAPKAKLFIGKGMSVSSICETQDGKVCVGTSLGIICYDSASLKMLRNTVDLGGEILFLLRQHGNSVLAGVRQKGLVSLNPISGIRNPIFVEQPLMNDHYVCFIDRDSGIWLSDGINDVLYFDEKLDCSTASLFSDGTRISHLRVDPEGFLWCRAGNSLCSIDPSSKKVIHKDEKHVCSSIVMKDDGTLVALMDGEQINAYTLKEGKATLKRAIPLHGEILSIKEGPDGNIWASSISDILICGDAGIEKTYHVGIEHPFTYLMPVSGTKRIFAVGLRDGIFEILEDGSVKILGDGFHNVSCMIMARDGTFWMGTNGDGIIHYDEHSGKAEYFGNSSGIIDQSIKTILQDADGNIWFSTSSHVACYNPWDRSISTIHDRNFSGGRFYDLISGALLQNGEVCFGGSGLITFANPKHHDSRERETPLLLEYVSVNDKAVDAGGGRLVLNHRDNTLSFRFAGLDYGAGALLNYSWKLDGYEDDWRFGASPDLVTYTYLPSGRYTFRARVRSQNGEWSHSEVALPLTIKPAPWASPAAKAGYVILAIGLLATGIWNIERLRNQKESLARARQREELKQQHIDFMTNLSHELRTPLSLILAPAKELAAAPLSEKEKELTSLIERNALRLQAISEQLLSNNGGRKDTEGLEVRENDLASLVKSTSEMFRYAAEEKGLTITMEIPETCIGWFDTEKVSKILGNLLSNAVKYTPEGGTINVSIGREGNLASISVKDNGIGIPLNKREHIFTRFDRLGAEESEVPGSGIGLNYAKSLALLHKGDLSYEPNPEGGSIFTFSLPLDIGSYSGSDISQTVALSESVSHNASRSVREFTMLIVEDTAELRTFLGNIFKDEYNVILASDGLEAEDDLKIAIPDIVLSDVIMPGKTGYALCSDIKSNSDWHHLPVILLTAKADAESCIEGMNAGADAYIPKPFDPDSLRATVKSLIRNRKILQDKVLNLTSTTLKEPKKVEEAKLNPAEKALVEKIHAYLDANLDNEQADISKMARELGISYSSLYAKVKSLTGKTPKAFANAYRMNIAHELLRTGGG